MKGLKMLQPIRFQAAHSPVGVNALVIMTTVLALSAFRCFAAERMGGAWGRPSGQVNFPRGTGGGNWGGIITSGLGALGNAVGGNDDDGDDDGDGSGGYYQRGPQYERSPQYVPPRQTMGYTRPAITPPQNSLPAPVATPRNPPPKVAPPSNSLALNLDYANKTTLGLIDGQIDQAEADKLQNIDEGIKPRKDQAALISMSIKTNLASLAGTTNGPTDAEIQQIKDAIDSGDAKKIKDAASLLAGNSNANVNGVKQQLQELAKVQAVVNQYDKVKDDVANGAPAAQVAIDSGVLKGMLKVNDPNDQNTAQNLDQLAQLAETRDIANALANDSFSLGNTWQPSHPGLIDVLFNPSLPAGQLVALGPTTVMAGTGGAGSMGVAQMPTAQALGLPIGHGQPVPATGQAGATTVGIVLRNAAENNGPISYVISDATYTMQPGYTQTLENGHKFGIKFSRGGSFGEAAYTLQDDTTYDFTVTPSKGWDIVGRTFRAVLDNTGGKQGFSYVMDNAPRTVDAGATQELSSKKPIVVRFDPGNGKAEATKQLDGGTYLIAVDAQANGWDLFPADRERALAGAQQAPVNGFRPSPPIKLN